ncbi:hypothetical protein Pmani_019736 [Petrolisthes manimaculis]|uniref:Uncharacterized protein n=1 Tax=Petrolisthes manimaculis TaxID=1843537 RepID=A0AAE1PHY4_9EUCA|nr:hypothetical protein Pmani_019736 [Petrolisthes manimaculis]
MAETRLTKRSAVNLGTAQPALSRARLVSSLPRMDRGKEGRKEERVSDRAVPETDPTGKAAAVNVNKQCGRGSTTQL